MPKYFKIPRLEREFFRGWLFVIVLGVALAVYAVIDSGDLAGGTGCVVRVTSGVPLAARVSPSASADIVGDRLAVGTTVSAKTVVQNGFRQLADGHWASTQFLVPEPGSRCG